MDNKSLESVLRKFVQSQGKVSLLSDDELQQRAPVTPLIVKQLFNVRRGKRECIGRIYGDEFIRHVNKLHKCWKHHGYGIQEEHFNRDILPVCRRFRFIRDDENGDEMVSTIDDWVSRTVLDSLGDSGLQRYLKWDFMTLVKKS